MDTSSWRPLFEALRDSWREAGLDLVHPFRVSEETAQVGPHFQLTRFDRPNCLGLVVGNTKALWPRFLSALAAQPRFATSTDPLDHYVEDCLSAVLGEHSSVAHELYYAHHTRPRAFPIQRLAENAGLASISPSHLSIHPAYGPWFALRAVVVLDVPGPAPSLRSKSACEGCSKPCVTALGRALELSPALRPEDIAGQASAWIAVRDACPVAPEARYSEAQLQYHYTKAPNWLGFNTIEAARTRR